MQHSPDLAAGSHRLLWLTVAAAMPPCGPQSVTKPRWRNHTCWFIISSGVLSKTLLEMHIAAQVVCCSKGRGRQMNAGAQRANGDMLLFLHADSQLPDGYDEAMQSAWCSALSKAPDALPRCVVGVHS